MAVESISSWDFNTLPQKELNLTSKHLVEKKGKTRISYLGYSTGIQSIPDCVNERSQIEMVRYSLNSAFREGPPLLFQAPERTGHDHGNWNEPIQWPWNEDNDLYKPQDGTGFRGCLMKSCVESALLCISMFTKFVEGRPEQTTILPEIQVKGIVGAFYQDSW